MNFQHQITLSKKDKQKGLKLPKESSPDLAYLCGVLAGDGNIFVRKEKHDYRIKCVGNPVDEKDFYIKVLQPLVKKLFNLGIENKIQDSGKTFGFYVYSKSLVEFLTKYCDLPIGKKKNQLRIPYFVKKSKLFFDFIRGLADTDFCLTLKGKRKQPCISGSSNSRRFFKEISKELKKARFAFYEVYDYELKDHRFKSGKSYINRIEITGKENFKLWKSKIGFSSPKHIEKMKNL